MSHRIEVGFKEGVTDASGLTLQRRIRDDLRLRQIKEVRIIEVYTINEPLRESTLLTLAENLFSDQITQVFSIDSPLADKFSWLIEVGFKPGVTDNVGKSAKEGIEDILKRQLTGQVFTSRQYLLTGQLSREEVERIARDLLANELIERWEIRDHQSWRRGRGIVMSLPIVKDQHSPRVREIALDVSEEELLQISRERVLALSLEEMLAIKDYFATTDKCLERQQSGLGNKPTDVELEALAQTWSEHCKHKIFNSLIEYSDEKGQCILVDSLFKTYIRETTEKISQRVDWLVSVFEDNAGIIRFNDQWNLVFKVETHNTPSALDPYGGAITGIVGVNRDPFGTGRSARLIFNTDVFCFAPPDYNDPLPPRLLHPKRVFEGVRKGVEHGGNKSGIPTVNGAIVFDSRYLGKPLVYCGTGGIMPSEIQGEPSHLKRIHPGDLIVMVGGRVGKDGIHGATFSSEELHEGSPVTAVQIGDPITQKKMNDFLLEARDQGLYQAITDNGAGGLSSSVGEMAKICGGCLIELEKVPLKYYGLDPWEILLSEAQERMTVAVHPESMELFLELSKRRGVESTPIGSFTNSGKFHVLYANKTVAFLDMEFLHSGLPQMRLKALWAPPRHEEPCVSEPADLTLQLEQLLGRLNICSKEYVIRQYDHEVQGTSVIKPLTGCEDDGPSDAAVLRPLLDSYEGIIVANGIVPRYGDIDTYHMVACSIDEAVRNALSVGGKLGQLAGLDNFCWCDPVQSEKTPDGKYKLAQLVRANQALAYYCLAYDLPCISGKDSMKNDYIHGPRKISIPPTLLFSVLGKMTDVRRAVTMDAKKAGDYVFILGMTHDELGGSEYYASLGYVGNNVPRVNAAEARELYKALSESMELGLISSCHDCSDGGLGVSLAETAFAGGLGLEIDLRHVPTSGLSRNDTIMFSESQSRFIVTVNPSHTGKFREIMGNLPVGCLGRVIEGPTFAITGLKGQAVVTTTTSALKKAWQKTLNW